MTRNRVIKLLLIPAMFLGTAQNLDAALKIYSVSGDVRIKHASGSSPLQRKADVAPSDVLVLADGGKVEILDADSRRIFRSTRSGSFSVEEIMANADEEASKVTKATNKKVLAAVKDNASARPGGFRQGGISRHETDAALSGLMALPEGTSYLSFLMKAGHDQEYDGSADIVLLRRDYPGSDDVFRFSVLNSLADPLYFNIINQRPDGEIHMYFPENPIAMPRRQTLISEYTFLKPDDTHGYIIVASDQNFTAADVERLLDSSFTPRQDFYLSLHML